MKKYSIIFFILVISCSSVKSQTLGISIESNAFTVYNFYDHHLPARGQIKHLFLSAGIDLFSDLHLSLKSGYGWNNYMRSSEYVVANSKIEREIKTTGFPLELTLAYQIPLTPDSRFKPYIGLGSGYYNYKTLYNEKSEGITFPDEFKTGGFSHFIIIGTSFEISENIKTFIEMKHKFLIDISSKWEYPEPTPVKYEADYGSAYGFLEISISAGIAFTL
ncbi:MAG: hypothetical protein RDU14_01945 [Melioribacteraceae bacterium]|nr:hypothetical protein [Melioribacteraceae bacterium]